MYPGGFGGLRVPVCRSRFTSAEAARRCYPLRCRRRRWTCPVGMTAWAIADASCGLRTGDWTPACSMPLAALLTAMGLSGSGLMPWTMRRDLLWASGVDQDARSMRFAGRSTVNCEKGGGCCSKDFSGYSQRKIQFLFNFNLEQKFVFYINVLGL